MTILIYNATLVHGQLSSIDENSALAIEDDRIVDLGDSQTMLAQYPDAEQIDVQNAVVMPGSICAHTHFYGAFSRGMPIPGPPMPDFPTILRRLWWSLDKALDAEAIRFSALMCAIDAVKHGTTLLIDHHASPNHIDGSLSIIADVLDEVGLRGVLCYEVSDRDGDEKAQAGIAENVRFLRESEGRENIAATFGLHASMTLSDQTLRACVDAAREVETGFHVHVAEHEADQYDSLQQHGMRIVPRLHQHHMLGSQSIVAHAVHCDAWELEMLRDTRTWVSHQPRSNMNNAVGAAAVDTMLDGGVSLCLGNDGLSNNMWAEWKTAYFYHKAAHRDPRRAPGDRIAQMALVNNARLAQQFFPGSQVGQLEVGAVADLIIIDYYPFTPFTVGNLPWHVVFGFESAMVRSTMVAGRFLMRDRELLTVDEQQAAAAARQIAPRVWEQYQKFAEQTL
jgi:putative selenium metabolism protein SsnA